MRLGANFLTKIVVGYTIGIGTLAMPSSIQAQNKPIAERQIEIEKAKQELRREIEARKELIERMRGDGIPEVQLEKVAKVFSEDFLKRLLELERAERLNNKEKNDFTTLELLGIVAAFGLLIFLSLLLESYTKDKSNDTKQSQDKKESPAQAKSNEINFLGEEISKIDWTKPADVDTAMEALRKFRDSQALLPEEQFGIRDALSNFISILEKVKQANDKEKLTIGDKPLLREIYFELIEALDKLSIALKPEPDLESEPTLSEWEELSTRIKALPKH